MSDIEIIEKVLKVQAEIEDKRKEDKRQKQQQAKREPRVTDKKPIGLKGVGEKILDNFGEYIEGAYWARYRRPYEKMQNGVLLQLRSGIDADLEYGDSITFTPHIKVESCYRGQIRFQMLNSSSNIYVIKHRKERYLELNDNELGALAVFGFFALLTGNRKPLNNAMVEYIAKLLPFKPGLVDLVGYDDIVQKCNSILNCTTNNIMNRQILLAGPPGCGKSMIAKKLAREHDEYIRCCLTSAQNWIDWVTLLANLLKSCDRKVLLLIDEVDELGLSRTVNRTSVFELLRFMDGVEDNNNVKIIATTNRPDDLDPALLRTGRFGPVMYVDKPTSEQKKKILKYFVDKYDTEVDLDMVIRTIDGKTTGADIRAAVEECIIDGVEITTEAVIQNLIGLLNTKDKLASIYV